MKACYNMPWMGKTDVTISEGHVDGAVVQVAPVLMANRVVLRWAACY